MKKDLLFKTSVSSGHFITRDKWWWLKCLGFTLVFLCATISAGAEIYKWQDERGTIRYSNKLPADPARILERIPTQNVPLVENTNGAVYYLNFPPENPQKNISAPDVPEFTVSPEIVKELTKDTPVAPLQSAVPPSPELTALTLRLAEVEKTLAHETENRVQREQEYAQTQVIVKNLENQNTTLKLVFAQMEKELEQLRGTVAASDRELTALKQNKEQQTQIEALRAEIEQLKARQAAAPVANEFVREGSLAAIPQTTGADATSLLVAGLVEKNNLMETVIKYQSNMLKAQNEYIQEIEAKLVQWQFPVQSPQEQPIVATTADNIQKEGFSASQTSGIKIVEKKERRKSSSWGIFSWLKK